jgi:hypothetical protein
MVKEKGRGDIALWVVNYLDELNYQDQAEFFSYTFSNSKGDTHLE